jgi:tripartite ATP-independent transporter DctM subunit
MSGLLVIIMFLVLALLGIPLAFSMAIPAALYLYIEGIPLEVVSHRMGNAVNVYPLLAVPLFIFAGNLMNTSGITDRIYDFANRLMGRARGGLAHVNIIGSLIFAGTSGAALADIGGVGNIEINSMKNEGYPAGLAATLTGASATIGPIFPPSIPLIIYGAAAQVSGVQLLIAGIVPGLLLTGVLMVMILILSYVQPHYYPPGEKSSPSLMFRSFTRALPALLAPIILVMGLLSGLFSPTEVAAVTAIYALILGFIYKELTLKGIISMSRETVRITANIMFIIAAAQLFGWVLTVEQIPRQLADLFLNISSNPIVLLLLANVILLIAGTFLESIAAILILTPILLPTLMAVGVNPIHFGVVMVFNLMIGLLTPPVGMSLYMVSIVAKVSVKEVLKFLWPYFIPLVVSLLILILWPELTLWLTQFV